jgi:hypothetical protein
LPSRAVWRPVTSEIACECDEAAAPTLAAVAEIVPDELTRPDPMITPPRAELVAAGSVYDELAEITPSGVTDMPDPIRTPPREPAVAGVSVGVPLTVTLIVSPLVAVTDIPAPLLVVT